jgi:hypothetical protein
LFFPHFHINEVNALEVQKALCQSFEQWGLPQAIKVDNGKPLGDPRHSCIPVLALWLIGLGIDVIWNPPRPPRANAKVERMQGTTSRWVEIEKCFSYEHLQRNLDKAAWLQREKYELRRLAGQSRKELYPQLWTNSRRYDREGFDSSRVYGYLSAVVFARKVNKKGSFNFYGQSVYLGHGYRNHTISLSYDASQHCFTINDANNTIIACLKADNFSRENIINLSVCQNRYIKC